jgi:hypothetical protein
MPGYKIDELMVYSETILRLRKLTMSYDDISCWLHYNLDVDASSNTINKLINNHLGGDPLGRVARSKSTGPEKEGSVYDFENEIRKLAVNGYNSKQIEKYLRLVKGYITRQGELRDAAKKMGVKIDSKGYVGTSPTDYDIVNGY